MDNLEQALGVTGLTDDVDDDLDVDDHSHNGMSDDDKELVKDSIGLIKVMISMMSLIM